MPIRPKRLIIEELGGAEPVPGVGTGDFFGSFAGFGGAASGGGGSSSAAGQGGGGNDGVNGPPGLASPMGQLSGVVPIPPVITVQPQSQTINSGQTATLSVTLLPYVNPPPGLSYQWYNNGSPIGGATGASYVTPPLSTDEDYYVIVSDDYGSQQSTTATITVTGGALAITGSPWGFFNDPGSMGTWVLSGQQPADSPFTAWNLDGAFAFPNGGTWNPDTKSFDGTGIGWPGSGGWTLNPDQTYLFSYLSGNAPASSPVCALLALAVTGPFYLNIQYSGQTSYYNGGGGPAYFADAELLNFNFGDPVDGQYQFVSSLPPNGWHPGDDPYQGALSPGFLDTQFDPPTGPFSIFFDGTQPYYVLAMGNGQQLLSGIGNNNQFYPGNGGTLGISGNNFTIQFSLSASALYPPPPPPT